VGQVRVGRGIALDLVRRPQAPAGPSIRQPDVIMRISELGACRQHEDPATAMPSVKVHRSDGFGALGQKRVRSDGQWRLGQGCQGSCAVLRLSMPWPEMRMRKGVIGQVLAYGYYVR